MIIVDPSQCKYSIFSNLILPPPIQTSVLHTPDHGAAVLEEAEPPQNFSSILWSPSPPPLRPI